MWKLLGHAACWSSKNIIVGHTPTGNRKAELTTAVALTVLCGSYSVNILTVNDNASIDWTQHEETLTTAGIPKKADAEADIRRATIS